MAMAMSLLSFQSGSTAALLQPAPRSNATATGFLPGSCLRHREVFGDGVIRLRSRARGSGDSSRKRNVKVMALFGLGVPELVVIAGVAALVFGPKKLPEIGKSLGKTVKSFQQAADEFQTEISAKKSEEENGPGSTEESKPSKENVEV